VISSLKNDEKAWKSDLHNFGKIIFNVSLVDKKNDLVRKVFNKIRK